MIASVGTLEGYSSSQLVDALHQIPDDEGFSPSLEIGGFVLLTAAGVFGFFVGVGTLTNFKIARNIVGIETGPLGGWRYTGFIILTGLMGTVAVEAAQIAYYLFTLDRQFQYVGENIYDGNSDLINFRQENKWDPETCSPLEYFYRYGWNQINNFGFKIDENVDPIVKKEEFFPAFLAQLDSHPGLFFSRLCSVPLGVKVGASGQIKDKKADVSFNFYFLSISPVLEAMKEPNLLTREDKGKIQEVFEKYYRSLSAVEFLTAWPMFSHNSKLPEEVQNWANKHYRNFQTLHQSYTYFSTKLMHQMGVTVSNPYGRRIFKITEDEFKTDWDKALWNDVQLSQLRWFEKYEDAFYQWFPPDYQIISGKMGALSKKYKGFIEKYEKDFEKFR